LKELEKLSESLLMDAVLGRWYREYNQEIKIRPRGERGRRGFEIDGWGREFSEAELQKGDPNPKATPKPNPNPNPIPKTKPKPNPGSE